jgi:hypothetical protein
LIGCALFGGLLGSIPVATLGGWILLPGDAGAHEGLIGSGWLRCQQ